MGYGDDEFHRIELRDARREISNQAAEILALTARAEADLSTADTMRVELQDQLRSAETRYQEESRIVDNVWGALGISTFEMAQGKDIATHVAERSQQLKTTESENVALKATIVNFRNGNDHLVKALSESELRLQAAETAFVKIGNLFKTGGMVDPAFIVGQVTAEHEQLQAAEGTVARLRAPRFIELASFWARQRHNEVGGPSSKLYDRHDPDFDTCGHHDCKLIQEALRAVPAPSESYTKIGESMGLSENLIVVSAPSEETP